jgi:hypothetical protein
MRTARQPNFLVAGAQKSGTSYLCSILARHPAVFHTAPKEPMFFQQENVTEASFASYLASFYCDAANRRVSARARRSISSGRMRSITSGAGSVRRSRSSSACASRPTARSPSICITCAKAGSVETSASRTSDRFADIDRCERLIGRSLARWKTLPEFTARETRW